MTTIDLISVRSRLVNSFITLAEKAKLIDSMGTLTSFPVAFTFGDKTNVKKQTLEEYVKDEYNISEENIEKGLNDLKDKGIVEVHGLDLLDERANYVQLTQKALSPTDEDLDSLFSVEK